MFHGKHGDGKLHANYRHLYDAVVMAGAPEIAVPRRPADAAPASRTALVSWAIAAAGHAAAFGLVAVLEFSADLRPNAEGPPPLEVDIIVDVPALDTVASQSIAPVGAEPAERARPPSPSAARLSPTEAGRVTAERVEPQATPAVAASSATAAAQVPPQPLQVTAAPAAVTPATAGAVDAATPTVAASSAVAPQIPPQPLEMAALEALAATALAAGAAQQAAGAERAEQASSVQTPEGILPTETSADGATAAVQAPQGTLPTETSDDGHTAAVQAPEETLPAETSTDAHTPAEHSRAESASPAGEKPRIEPPAARSDDLLGPLQAGARIERTSPPVVEQGRPAAPTIVTAEAAGTERVAHEQPPAPEAQPVGHAATIVGIAEGGPAASPAAPPSERPPSVNAGAAALPATTAPQPASHPSPTDRQAASGIRPQAPARPSAFGSTAAAGATPPPAATPIGRVAGLQPALAAREPVGAVTPNAANLPALPGGGARPVAIAPARPVSQQPYADASIVPAAAPATPVHVVRDNDKVAPLTPEDGNAAVAIDPDQQIEAVVTGYGCARLNARYDVSGKIVVSGHLKSDEERDALLRRLHDIPGVQTIDAGNLYKVGEPYCQVFAFLGRPEFALSADQKAGFAGFGNPVQAAVKRLSEDDPFVLNVRGAEFDSYVYVDYYSADGSVSHLIPTAKPHDNFFGPNQGCTLGDGCGPPMKIAGPSFGLKVVLVMASADALFDTLRPKKESASDYLKAVAAAIDELERRGRSPRVEYGYYLIYTSPRVTQ